MTKTELRAYIRRMKAESRAEDLRVWSAEICARVMQLPEWKAAKTVLLYAALADEVQTEILREEVLAAGKRLLLPVVQGEQLVLRLYTSETPMRKGAYNIEEPEGCDFSDYANIDLAVVPAMAYDAKGNRLGRGKGYYDRLLSQLQCPLIGIVYPFQMLAEIPTEPWDVSVHQVITA